MSMEEITHNATIFSSSQLYWIILFQSSARFIVHSLNISFFRSTPAEPGILLDTTAAFNLQIEFPLHDTSHVCTENLGQERKSRTYYCQNSMPSFIHQIVVFRCDYINTEFVSMRVRYAVTDFIAMFLGKTLSQVHWKHNFYLALAIGVQR